MSGKELTASATKTARQDHGTKKCDKTDSGCTGIAKNIVSLLLLFHNLSFLLIGNR